MPNPRGSTGRGRAFIEAVIGDMGGTDALDDLAGVDALIERGIADPERIGVTGGSYGGYMSCWLPVVDQRFKASVAISPVTDFYSEHWNSNIGAWDAWFLGGEPQDGTSQYQERSPVFLADRVTTPTLLTAGTEDRCTPPGQAMEFYRALRANDVPTEVAIYPGEGHGVRKFPAYLDLVTRTTAWFERFMPAGRRWTSPIWRDGVPRPRTQDVPDQRVARAGLAAIAERPRRVHGCVGLEGRSRPRLVRGHLPQDGVPEAFVLRARGRAIPDEVALTTNISIALSTIASCLDLSGERRTVILSELDFPTDGHVWIAWARKTGAEIRWLRSADGLTIPVEEYDRAIDERTALVMVNRVLYRSSAIVDAKAVCAIARERGALSFVDDYHGLGIVPLDLHDLGCDLYTAGVLKWMLGGPGLVFLYARRDLLPSLEPAVTGWFAQREPFAFDTEHLDYHPTARRLEHGTPPAPVFFIAQGGIDIISEVGPATIRARQGELTDHLIARADEAGLEVRTPRDRELRGGVVNVKVGPEAEKICHELLARDVCTDFRGDGLRISPHFFNTEADIDRCFEELRSLV